MHKFLFSFVPTGRRKYQWPCFLSSPFLASVADGISHVNASFRRRNREGILTTWETLNENFRRDLHLTTLCSPRGFATHVNCEVLTRKISTTTLAIRSLTTCLRDQGASSALCKTAKNAQHNSVLIHFILTPSVGRCQQQVQQSPASVFLFKLLELQQKRKEKLLHCSSFYHLYWIDTWLEP